MKIFITGIPTGGKSYLAEKLEKEFGAIHIELDDLRESLINDPKYKDWVSFYYNQPDEKTYLTKTLPEEQWNNLVKQSEAIWPALTEEIDKYKEEDLVVFESVNLLPHLIQEKYPDSIQIVLIGESLESTFERNKKSPRWGNTEELQKLEAEYFFNTERPRYKKEAEKYNLPAFETGEVAFEYLKEKFPIIQEYIGHSGVKYIFEYHECDSFNHLPKDRIKQCYAVAFHNKKMIIVHNGNKNTWGLVGGSIEEGEIPEETLIRETKEESNTKVLEHKPIGYQKVIDTRGIQRPFYQLRYFAIVEPYGPFESDPANIIDKIAEIDPSDYKKYFDWGEIGEKIIRKAIFFKNLDN